MQGFSRKPFPIAIPEIFSRGFSVRIFYGRGKAPRGKSAGLGIERLLKFPAALFGF